MKNKLLFLGGALVIGTSFAYFFKKQLELALDFDYNLKDFSIVELTTDYAVIKAQIEVINKSSFQIIINNYDIDCYYKDHFIANTQSDIPFTVLPDKTFLVETTGRIDLKQSLSTLFPFVQDVLQKRPIDVQLDGTINVRFLGINHSIKLDHETFNYSNNLLADLGLEKPVDKIQNKASELLGKIGIKI